MKIRKYIQDEFLKIDVDGRASWVCDLNTGIRTILNPNSYNHYRNDWTNADYSDTPELIFVRAIIKMRSETETQFKGFLEDGLRPHHIFESQTERNQSNWIGDILFTEQLKLRLGGRTEATVRFLFRTPIEQFLYIGRLWWLRAEDIIADCEMKAIELPTTSY